MAGPGLHILNVTTKGGPTRLEGKGCYSPGAEGKGAGSSTGWLGAAGGDRDCRHGVALSKFSSFHLSSRHVVSPLVSSSSRGLVALSMSCRQSDRDQSIQILGNQCKAQGQSKPSCWVQKQVPVLGSPHPTTHGPTAGPGPVILLWEPHI